MMLVACVICMLAASAEKPASGVVPEMDQPKMDMKILLSVSAEIFL
jgi:hypothetical protein